MNSGPALKRIALLASLCFCAGTCFAQAKSVPLRPDTPAGKLRSIAYMPYYGVPVAPTQQQELSAKWSKWWNDIYPGTDWTQSQGTIDKLLKSNAFKAWQDSERTFQQTGAMEPHVVQQLCEVMQTDGLLQALTISAETGSTLGLAGTILMGPLTALIPTKASRAAMTMTLFNCGTRLPVWSKTTDVKYNRNYTPAELAEYAHEDLAGYIPQ